MFSKSTRIGDSLRIIVYCIFVIVNINLLYSQSDDTAVKGYYQWFDKAVGLENSGLYNGVVYIEKHRMRDKKQKFFDTTEFLKGTIDYDGQLYFDVPMKYDVNEDQVLIRLNRVLLLKKSKIKSFSINGHQFEKLEQPEAGKLPINGFFEVLFEKESFKLIKKHKKEVREKYGDKLVFHEFVDKNEYFLFYQNQYHGISSRGDVVKVFPDFAAKIKKQFPKSRRKLNQEEYLFALLNGVHLMFEEKPKVIE